MDGLNLLMLILIEVVVLFFLTRSTIQSTFTQLRRWFKHTHTVYGIMSALFFPGTVLHELSHALMAMITFQRVHEIHVFPSWDHNSIKLGYVYYAKKDVFRGILVGIAPIFAGLATLWFIAQFRLFPTENIWWNLLFGYLVFTISTTMFSSKQDLIDVIYIIPVIIIALALYYFFQPDLTRLTEIAAVIVANSQNFLYTLNYCLLLTLVIHLVLNLLLFISSRVR